MVTLSALTAHSIRRVVTLSQLSQLTLFRRTVTLSQLSKLKRAAASLNHVALCVSRVSRGVEQAKVVLV